MPLPSQLANLTRAGGDRYADKRALLAVIRGALEESLSDAEIRKFYGLKPGAPVSLAKRRRMARMKSGPVYDGLIDGLIAGATEPFEYYEPGQFGPVHKRDGGVNFGGIFRFGTWHPQSVSVVAVDQWGVSLASRGIATYQKEVPANGYYATRATAAPGYFLFAGAYWLGPIPWSDLVAGQGFYQNPANQTGWVNVDLVRWGTKGADDVTRAWYYVEPGDGIERRVKWQSMGGPAAGLPRMKAKILEAFWCELNGMSWDALGAL